MSFLVMSSEIKQLAANFSSPIGPPSWSPVKATSVVNAAGWLQNSKKP
eukprot:CAMPEP_0196151994 /NCGR_PEP_ID=MMETSP0910-20130528/34719_1 /TAXON_ID=49265 /ORGANISM="Thalassiosira rotula, Strain GSO102" /LENGTH=47 /DNA_ID= /DNA_START= /DNA_END= /DNA_ORIENTATION=